jgi:hypothetical protein
MSEHLWTLLWVGPNDDDDDDCTVADDVENTCHLGQVGLLPVKLHQTDSYT